VLWGFCIGGDRFECLFRIDRSLPGSVDRCIACLSQHCRVGPFQSHARITLKDGNNPYRCPGLEHETGFRNVGHRVHMVNLCPRMPTATAARLVVLRASRAIFASSPQHTISGCQRPLESWLTAPGPGAGISRLTRIGVPATPPPFAVASVTNVFTPSAVQERKCNRGRAESQFRVNARMQNILIDPIECCHSLRSEQAKRLSACLKTGWIDNQPGDDVFPASWAAL